MLLLGQATPDTAVWIVSTDPFVCITIEPPLFAPGLQNMKAFLWVPPGAGYPDTDLILRMVALYAHDVESTAAPTTLDIVQGSTDPAHTPPPWLVCDSPQGVEPAWLGLVHTSEPRVLVEHRHFDAEAWPPSTLALHWPDDINGFHRLTGSTVFDTFHKELALIPYPPFPPTAVAPTRR